MEDGVAIEAIVGKTIESFEETEDRLLLVCSDGDAFTAYHMQDCCEYVRIYDVAGSLEDLVGATVTAATCEESGDWPEDVRDDDFYLDSFTWTIHTFETANAKVVVRWIGTSNGYYSESVYFQRTHKPVA